MGLINTVLDIAKTESGQFTLNIAEYAIDSVVETVRVATESLAQSKKLAIRTEVARSLPVGLGDEQRLTQVLLMSDQFAATTALAVAIARGIFLSAFAIGAIAWTYVYRFPEAASLAI